MLYLSLSWLLLVLELGLVLGSKCPTSCQCLAQEVLCSGAGLTEYPDNLPLDTRRLSLAHNNLTVLPSLELGLLRDLVFLDCSHNQLKEVLESTFAGLIRLLNLDLSCNQLTVVGPGTFSPLHGLLQLNLSHNPQLQTLPPNAFGNDSALQLLDLRHAGLHRLDRTSFSGLSALNTLYLSGNPWSCNCSLLDFTIFLLVKHHSYPDELNATCSEPVEMAGWPIAEAGNPLRYLCLTNLNVLDYLFLFLIGFCIFVGGTLAAWMTGVCAVLYQRALHTAEEEDEEEHLWNHSRMQAGHDSFPHFI
ncbi:leucine-rich repeat-containing protein 52-like [Erinaceus europaeus]|uniref:Leucine-rich repeat-containing protein 52-like n=1 Tax=Erinaceus europaeus TaxID=9365 RepID=A0A1S3ACL7_ERIEU|nr:leucine-rich repeat-containing protein 52-like [Erinaceus europaeus]